MATTSNVNFVTAMGAGSGVDTKSLAQNLVEAERAPRKSLIDGKIKKEEAHITGYGAIKSLLSTLQGALSKLKDTSDFSSITPNNTQPAAFGVTAGSSAGAGSYDIEVRQIAKATRLATYELAATDTPLNNMVVNGNTVNSAFDLSFVKTSARKTEQQTVTFKPLAKGESVTVAGLTLTATADLGMSAEEVAAAIISNDPQGKGGLSGSLSSNWAIGTSSGANLLFTSTIANTNVADIALSSDAASGGPTVSSQDGNDGITNTVQISTATPAGIVSAVNSSTATTGVSAQLIKSGTGYSIVFTGPTGADNDFSVSGLPSQVSMRANALQTAQDAQLSVNGLPITSNSNRISDTIPGVTLDLYAPTTQGTSARLDLNRQTNAIKENLNALVSAYNDFNAGLKELGDSKSTLDQFGGTLAGDSTVNTVRNLVRSMFGKDGKVYPAGDTSKDPLNPDVNAAWQVGLSFDRYGKMTLDEGKLDKALTDHFDQVVTFFTANGNGQSVYSTEPGGIAGDAVKSIDKLLRSTGLLAQQTDSSNARIKQYNDQLAKLEDRMSMLLDRYTKQFSAMDSIVGESSSTRTSLKSSFEGLMAMYTNK